MCRASHLAGKAINVSKTTAPHALSYHLTSKHNIPHGMAVAVTLSSFLKFNAGVTAADCVDPRGPKHVHDRIAIICRVMQADDIATACANIDTLISQLDCPASLAEAGIVGTDAIWNMIDSVNLERMANNPRLTTSAILLELLSDQASGRTSTDQR